MLMKVVKYKSGKTRDIKETSKTPKGAKVVGHVIHHCHSGKTGRISATKNPVSYSKALSIHRAIGRSRK